MLSLLLAATLGFAAPGDDDLIWIEGEAAKTKDVSPPHGWYTSVKKDMLSGGEFLSNYGAKDGLATYDVPVKKAGTYTLWVRANPIGAALSWRLGEGDWKGSRPASTWTTSTWPRTAGRTCASWPG